MCWKSKALHDVGCFHCWLLKLTTQQRLLKESFVDFRSGIPTKIDPTHTVLQLHPVVWILANVTTMSTTSVRARQFSYLFACYPFWILVNTLQLCHVWNATQEMAAATTGYSKSCESSHSGWRTAHPQYEHNTLMAVCWAIHSRNQRQLSPVYYVNSTAAVAVVALAAADTSKSSSSRE